jgi:hypothetical protein
MHRLIVQLERAEVAKILIVADGTDEPRAFSRIDRVLFFLPGASGSSSG